MTALGPPLASSTPLADDSGAVVASQALTGSLYTNVNTFPAFSTISAGGIVVPQNNFFIDPDTFFTGVLTLGEAAPKFLTGGTTFINLQEFYTANLVAPIPAGGLVETTFFNNANTFYTAILDAPIPAGGLVETNFFTDPDTFYLGLISLEGSIHLAAASLFIDPDTFFMGEIAPEEIPVIPPNPDQETSLPGGGNDGDRRRRRPIIYRNLADEKRAQAILDEQAMLEEKVRNAWKYEYARRQRVLMMALTAAALLADD